MAGKFTAEALHKLVLPLRGQEQPEWLVYYPYRPGWPPDGEWFWRYADGREIPAK